MRKNIIVLLLLLTSFVTSTAFAQEIAEKPCDTKYWDQITHRAWLETEREIMQNQNLIFKPDSVLDYVCYDQFASIAAAQGGEIFVHTNYFGEKIIKRGANESTDVGITKVVYFPLSAYRIANFDYGSTNADGYSSGGGGGNFLGGRSQAMNSASNAHTPRPPTGNPSAAYSCSHMSAVWQAAKCANFIHAERFKFTDGFYPFETIKGLDGKPVAGYMGDNGIKETREFPKPCTGGTGVISWETGVQNATNKGEKLYQFQTPLGKIFKEVNEKIEPGKCLFLGVPTGITVITKNGPQGRDGVCSNPGCTYTNTGGTYGCQDIGEAPI